MGGGPYQLIPQDEHFLVSQEYGAFSEAMVQTLLVEGRKHNLQHLGTKLSRYLHRYTTLGTHPTSNTDSELCCIPAGRFIQ